MAKILPVQINNKEEVEGDYTVGKLLKVGSGYKLGVQVADVDRLRLLTQHRKTRSRPQKSFWMTASLF